MATQRIIVEFSGENFAVTLRDIDSMNYPQFVKAIQKKLEPKLIPEDAVFACVDNAGRIVRLKDDDDVSYFFAVAKVLEQKERAAVVTIKLPAASFSSNLNSNSGSTTAPLARASSASSPAPTPPPAIRTSADSPRPVSSSPNPAQTQTPASGYVPSYYDSGDELDLKPKFVFDPSSDRVVVLYDGHEDDDNQISPFTPHAPSPIKVNGEESGVVEQVEDKVNGTAVAKSPEEGEAKRGRGGSGSGSERRGRGRGGGGGGRGGTSHSQAPAPAPAPTGDSAGPSPAGSEATPATKPSKIPKAAIPDGQDGWGGSGYEESSKPPPAPKQTTPQQQPTTSPTSKPKSTTSPIAKPPSSTSQPTSPPDGSPAQSQSRRIVLPPPTEKPSSIPTSPITTPKLSKRELDELMAERKKQAELLEQRHQAVLQDKLAAQASEQAFRQQSQLKAKEAAEAKREQDKRRKESAKVWEEQEAERRENMRRKMEKMEMREWDLDKKKELPAPPPVSPPASSQRGRGAGRGASGRGRGAGQGGAQERSPKSGSNEEWTAPAESKPLVDEGWK